MPPLVSVVMPVFNGLRAGPGYLNQSIDSLVRQDYEGPLEIVIIDDGSTDGTGDVIRETAERIKKTHLSRRIELITRPHAGVTKSLNAGARHATGELVARQDADDYSEPERITRQVAYLTDHAEVAVVGSAVRVIHGSRRKDEVWYRSATDRLRIEDFRKQCPLAHGSTMIRADVLKQVGYYNESYPHSQDYDLFWRIVRRWEIATIPDPLYCYRVHGNRVTTQKFRLQLDCANRIRQRINREFR